jgi:carbon-monoxide dehydrogenase large subunit
MTFCQGEALGAFAWDETQFLRGTADYVDDMRLAGEVHGYVLRSPHAHARILHIDPARALQAEGVLAVLTASDLAGIVRPLGCVMELTSYDGTRRKDADRVVLAADRVRHAGDGVAFIVAETRAQARAAAELVAVAYEPLAPVIVPDQAECAVPVWPAAPDNICFDWRFGDADSCRRLFAEAAHVVRIKLRNPRVIVNAIEPRAAIGIFDAESGRLTLITNTQGPHFVRRVLAEAFGLPPSALRVVTPNVGGGFGSKIFAYPEHALVLCAARALGRPVRWVAGRSEAFLSDTQGRDHLTEAALALDESGHFLALSVRATVNLGAYLSQYAPLITTGVGAPVQAGAYRLQAIEIGVRGVFTNTVPVDSYRGAGRPEATYVLERLIDRAARVLGTSPAGLRARNLPGSQEESMVAASGLAIDGGRFLDNQIRCLALADHAGFPARKEESARRGLKRGFGFANYLESNGGLAVAKMIEPGHLPVESAALRFGRDGTLRITVGTQSTGQDHATPMALYAARTLGLEITDVTVCEGDSDSLARGGGTGGSKSLLTSSVAIGQAVHDVIGRGRALLAKQWGRTIAEILFENGLFACKISNRTMRVAEIAKEYPGVLDGQSEGILHQGSCANGCHACEVEIDPETGETHIVLYTAVDDFGQLVNPDAVRGQVQGGVAQGIGQALLERTVYDPVSGQLLSGSLLDYALPHACDVPVVAWTDNGLISRTNIFGAKACGEAGTAAAPPAIMNAIADALADCPGIEDLQMPACAADIWRLIHAAP